MWHVHVLEHTSPNTNSPATVANTEQMTRVRGEGWPPLIPLDLSRPRLLRPRHVCHSHCGGLSPAGPSCSQRDAGALDQPRQDSRCLARLQVSPDKALSRPRRAAHATIAASGHFLRGRGHRTAGGRGCAPEEEEV
eukprot:6637320-Prymnesium_polylepis.1